MKKLIQTTSFAILACLLAFSSLQAQGPDAYGYTWKTSNDPGGPVFSWIDITAVGTQVAGLGDDNAAAPMPMGMGFHFYWSDYDKLTVGSNGRLSFDNVSNIASCFPAIPTANAINNLICPLMSDLNFGNSSPGKVYTHYDQTPGDEKFIISYEAVTFWTQADPIFGSNTFQVILSKADSSITFQYGTMDADFAYTCTGSGKVAAGIENLTGGIGLQVYSGIVPPSNHAVKFYYPQSITFSVADVGPTANNNAENEGIFLYPGFPVALNATISNTGNTAVSSGIAVDALVQSFPDGNIVYTDDQLIASLANGAEQTVNFAPATADWAPGTYSFEVYSDNSEDLNPSNDLNATEVNVVDTTGGIISLGYVTGVNASGFIQWAGGGDGTGGGGIEIAPPVYPITIAGAEVGIAGGSVDGFTFRLFDDDGPNGGPGTELTSLFVAGAEYVAGNWNQYLLDDPITITSGSFYLGWFMEGPTVAMLVEAEGPQSNRGYEILSGAWAKYRVTADLMLRALAEAPTDVIHNSNDVVVDSKVQVYPNPSSGAFFIDNTLGDVQVENPRILNTLGAVVFEGKQTIPSGQQLKVQADLPAGIYCLEVTTIDGRRVVRKLVVN